MKQAVIPTTHMNGDIAAQLRVGGLPDLAHAAFANESGHVIVAESGADLKGHEFSGWRPLLALRHAHHSG